MIETQVKQNLIKELHSFGIYETVKNERLETLDIYGLSRMLAVQMAVRV